MALECSAGGTQCNGNGLAGRDESFTKRRNIKDVTSDHEGSRSGDIAGRVNEMGGGQRGVFVELCIRVQLRSQKKKPLVGLSMEIIWIFQGKPPNKEVVRPLRCAMKANVGG